MGACAVKSLAAEGRSVIMACRNTAKAEAVHSRILKDIPGSKIEVRQLDLASMASVRAFAEGLEGERFAALFNNAGVINRDYSLTADGFEATFAVNYFAPVLLTRLLEPGFVPGARVVSMTSLTRKWVRISADSLDVRPKDFSQLGTYARAKLAMVYFSQEFSRRNPSLMVNLADPGVVNSNMISMGRWFDPLADILFRPLCTRPEKGVQPALRALESEVSGHIFSSRGHSPVSGRFASAQIAADLWEKTEQMLGL